MPKRDTPEPNDTQQQISRRQFMQWASGSVVASAAALSSNLLSDLSQLQADDDSSTPNKRPRVGVLFTEFRHRSHAHVLIENFLQPYLFNGHKTDPGVDVVSFWGDQFPKGADMSRDVSKQFGIPFFNTIDEALCLGTKELAVDAVLLIGEHGNYPSNDLGQRMYPRKQFFDQAVATMIRCNRFVPLFNDKHLSYRWDWAKEMYDTAQELGIPLMAGSSVPLAERRPNIELPADAEISEAVSIHGGGFESYGFHGLEVLQSNVERRSGGETGVASVEVLTGDALFQAGEAGLWSTTLAEKAMEAELGKPQPIIELMKSMGPAKPAGIHVRYNDGFKATVLQVGNSATRWNFACQIKDDKQLRATAYNVGPWQNRCLFKALSHAIQTHFRNKKAPYPVERTLLTTGILDAAMQSRHRGGIRLPTPHLNVTYAPQDFTAMREFGKSWEIITDDMPEPRGITPHGLTTDS